MVVKDFSSWKSNKVTVLYDIRILKVQQQQWHDQKITHEINAFNIDPKSTFGSYLFVNIIDKNQNMNIALT